MMYNPELPNNGKIVPYHPQWAKPGCIALRHWTEEFVSGNQPGVRHWVEYKDGRGKKHECVKWVKWKNKQ